MRVNKKFILFFLFLLTIISYAMIVIKNIPEIFDWDLEEEFDEND